jgi:hypothetical protein
MRTAGMIQSIGSTRRTVREFLEADRAADEYMMCRQESFDEESPNFGQSCTQEELQLLREAQDAVPNVGNMFNPSDFRIP